MRTAMLIVILQLMFEGLSDVSARLYQAGADGLASHRVAVGFHLLSHCRTTEASLYQNVSTFGRMMVFTVCSMYSWAQFARGIDVLCCVTTPGRPGCSIHTLTC